MAYLNHFNPEKVDSVPAARQQFRLLKEAIDNGEIGGGGGGTGAVDSVNGKTGIVVLDAEDVGAYEKPSSGIPASDLASGVQDVFSQVATNTEDIAANAQDIAILQAAYAGLTQSDIVVGALPVSGVVNTIYRVPSTSSYSDYMWNGTEYVLMATYDNAIDDVPTAGSNNLARSGGIKSEIDKVSELITGVDYNHTFTTDEYSGIIYDGTKFTAANTTFDSFFIELREGVKYTVTGTYLNKRTFNVKPAINVVAAGIRIISAQSFTAGAQEKWLFVSITKSSYTGLTISYNIKGIAFASGEEILKVSIGSSSEDIVDGNNKLATGGIIAEKIEPLEVNVDGLNYDHTFTSDEYCGIIHDGTKFIAANTNFNSFLIKPIRDARYTIGSAFKIWSCNIKPEVNITAPVTEKSADFIAGEQDKWLLITVQLSSFTNLRVTGTLLRYEERIENVNERINTLFPNSKSIEYYQKNRNYDKTNYQRPIVSFCFDRFNTTAINTLSQYDVKATFAIDGYSSPSVMLSTLKSAGYIDLLDRGFDLITHGASSSIQPNVGQSGVCSEDEYTTLKIFDSIREQFRYCNIKDDIVVGFNNTQTCAATYDIIREYYKAMINGSTNNGVNEFDVDYRDITRAWIENASSVDNLKNIVLSNLNRPVLLLFGTHSDEAYNSGKLVPFLEFIKTLEESGAIINVGLHEAINIIDNYRKCYNVIPKRTDIYKLRQGEQFNYNGTCYRCINGGKPAVYKVTVAGTAQNGSFKLNIDGSGSYLTIQTTSGMTAEDVAERFFTHGSYYNYRTNVIDNVVLLQRSRTDNTSASLEITNNTSGITFTIEQIVEPVASEYVEI